MPPPDTDRSTAVYDVLASAYRRQVMSYLATCEDVVASVEELADELVDHDETADDRRRVAIRLHHVALPKLAGAGFIEYDARTQTARVREYPPVEWRALPPNVEGA